MIMAENERDPLLNFNADEMHKPFRATGNNSRLYPCFLAISVCMISILSTLMVFSWTRTSDSNELESSLLIVVNSISIVFMVILTIRKCTFLKLTENAIQSTRSVFTITRVVFFAIFGCGYCTQCMLNIWKLGTSQFCKGTGLGLANNALALAFALFQIVYVLVFHNKKKEERLLVKVLSWGVILGNMSIWLDTLFSQSADIFDLDPILAQNNTNIHHGHNFTNCSENESAVSVINKTEPFLVPLTIEFALMAIGFLFKESRNNTPTENSTEDDQTENTNLDNECAHIIAQVSVFALSMGIFLYTFICLLTGSHFREQNLHELPVIFKLYVIYQLIVKTLLSVFIIPAVLTTTSFFQYRLNNELALLFVSMFGNIVYDTFNFIALIGIKVHIVYAILAVLESILSIIIAIFEVAFIMSINVVPRLDESPENGECGIRRCWTKFRSFIIKNLRIICSFLFMLNIGLWASDSIGETRIPIFSVFEYVRYTDKFWEIMARVIFPLTIFFRFYTATEFLRLWKDHP